MKEASFNNTPDGKFYFPSRKHEETLHLLRYGIEAGKGAVLLSGEIGCGKTLLSCQLILNLPKDHYDIALIANPTFEGKEFLRELLYQLGIHTNGSKIDLLHQLNNHLLKNHKNGVSTLVIIDEAQAIQDEGIFEELRLLLNFQLHDTFLLTLVILGQPELQGRLMANPQLSQRIAVRGDLQPLDDEETKAYIRFRLNRAGCAREIWTDAALTRIAHQTNGIPRRINTLCDLCLFFGHKAQVAEMDEVIVDAAMKYVL